MQKVMMLIAIMFSFVLAACQTATTTRNTTSSEGVSVGNDWKNSETGRKFRNRSGVSCRAWNRGSPTFADEISQSFSSQHQEKIDQLRKNEASWVQLCNDLPMVKTKNQARSWLKDREGIARVLVENDKYWIGSPSRWSDVEEAKIWHAFLCREGVRSMKSSAQVTAEVIAENSPWNATRATQKAENIAAKASNVCSRGYDGVEKKFISESKGVWESYLTLWRLSE